MNTKGLLFLLFCTTCGAQVQNLTLDKNGNVVTPVGAKFPTGIPLRVVDAPASPTDVVNKTYADSLVTGGGAVWGGITGTLSNQTDLQTALNAKQPLDGDLTALAALTGTNNIYYRSATSTWSSVTIGGNMTFTDGTLDSVGGGGGTVTSITATAPIVVTPTPLVSTGVISLGVADTTHNGYLSSTDWNTFNGKQNAITPSALTKSDDTNITLSLGGSPTTALLGAVSITAGWTGTLAVSRGGTGGATAPAHQYFGNNTGSTAAPGFHQIDYSELSGTPTVPSDISALHYLTTQAESGLSNEFNLGSLASGLLKQTVAGSVSTPSIATAGTDYEVPLTFSQSVSRATNTVTLSGDSASPGNTMLYGTNGSGTKGWYAQPVAGGTGTVTSITATSPIVVTPTPLTATGVVSLNAAVDLTLTAAQTVTLTDAGTATIPAVLTVIHNSSGTAANFFGTALDFKGESSTTNGQMMGEVSTYWSTAADASRASVMRFSAAGSTGLSAVYTQIFNDGGLSSGYSTSTSPGSGIISAGNGYTIAGAAPTSGKILQSGGASFAASSATWPTLATTGKVIIGNGTNYVESTPTWPTAAGTTGYLVRSDGTNFTSYPNQQTNASVTNLSVSTSDIYLTGSSCVVAAGDFKAKGQYRCVFDMAKTAGTGAIVITLRVGTAGTTSDAAIQTYTFGAGTSVSDTGVFDVVVNWRTVGGGTSAVMQGICRGLHNLSTTGMFNNAAGWLVIGSPSPSSGFNSTAATTIGLSFNGSTAFAGTNTMVQAQLQQ